MVAAVRSVTSLLSPPEWSGEVIAGFPIHPLASLFPLIEGELLAELLESVAERGLAVPVEVHEGLVTDGRSRLRAIEVLRQRGLDVEVRTVEWQPTRGETLEEHLYETNVLRRHLAADQRAALGIRFLPQIREARAARQAASRFGAAERTTAAAQSSPPQADGESSRRSSREKDGRSTAGALASFTKVSVHKARQAIALADDIDAGLVPPEEMDAVLRGAKPLCRAGRSRPRRSAKKVALPARESREIDLDSFHSVDTVAPKPTIEEVSRGWLLLKARFAIADHAEVRRLLGALIAEEQERFDR